MIGFHSEIGREILLLAYLAVGDDVAVGGNQTGVGVTVANAMGVSVGRIGVGVLAGAKEHAAKRMLMLRIERRYFIFLKDKLRQHCIGTVQT